VAQSEGIVSSGERPRWLSIKQLASYLGRSVQSIRKDVREKKLPASRIGGQIKFDLADIDRLMQARKVVTVEKLLEETVQQTSSTTPEEATG
jgi:excisionase family DNA binding protein